MQVAELPNEGVQLFQAQFVRLNITCPNNVAGSLMFRFQNSSAGMIIAFCLELEDIQICF